MQKRLFGMRKWESGKHKSWAMPDEGYVTKDGSLLGTAGMWGECGWSVVQLHYDEKFGPLHGKYGSTEAEFEVHGLLLPSQESNWTYQGACRQ